MRSEGRTAAKKPGTLICEKWRVERAIRTTDQLAIYEAKDLSGTRVLLKVIHPYKADDATLAARMKREAYVGNRIKHPAIVKVLGDGVTPEGSVAIALEWVEGETLEELRVRRGGMLPPDEVTAYGITLCDALQAAHDERVIHRDVRPESFIVTKKGDLRVSEFSSARVIGEAVGDDERTAVGATIGGPAFMSPEQARGQRERVDMRSDVFSLGATLYTLVTGKTVHVADNPLATLLAASREKAKPVRSVVRAQLPDALADAIDRALKFEPSDRFPSMRTMKNALAKKEGAAPVARPAGLRTTGPAGGSQAPAALSPSQRPPPPLAGRPALPRTQASAASPSRAPAAPAAPSVPAAAPSSPAVVPAAPPAVASRPPLPRAEPDSAVTALMPLLSAAAQHAAQQAAQQQAAQQQAAQQQAAQQQAAQQQAAQQQAARAAGHPMTQPSAAMPYPHHAGPSGGPQEQDAHVLLGAHGGQGGWGPGQPGHPGQGWGQAHEHAMQPMQSPGMAGMGPSGMGMQPPGGVPMGMQSGGMAGGMGQPHGAPHGMMQPGMGMHSPGMDPGMGMMPGMGQQPGMIHGMAGQQGLQQGMQQGLQQGLQQGMQQPGAQQGMGQPGMQQPGMMGMTPGMQPGMGMMPGMGMQQPMQPMGMQPGMGMMQPGGMPQGMQPPGMMQPGMGMMPGMGQAQGLMPGGPAPGSSRTMMLIVGVAGGVLVLAALVYAFVFMK